MTYAEHKQDVKDVEQVTSSGRKEGRSSCWARLASWVWPAGSGVELRATLRMAGPLVVTQSAELMFLPVATMIGGHLGTVELDTIALSTTLINVFGMAIMTGLASSCETVFSQSYGYGNPKMIGIYLQRALAIHLLALFPCCALYLNMESVLLLLSQDPEVARLSGQYMLYFIPGICAIAITMVLRRYTQCQGQVTVHVFIMLTGHAVHGVCQYLFLYQFNMGTVGSSLALDATYIYIAVVTVAYTLCSKEHRQAWGGWNVQGLQEWGSLSKLAVYGMFMVCFEWWALEIGTIVAGFVGVTEQAAQGVAVNMDTMIYGIPSGFGIACCIRVGFHLGAGQPEQAHVASHIGILITVFTGAILSTLFSVARFELPKLFSNEQDVINLVASILPIMSVYLFFTGGNIIGRGVFRGIGWQLRGAILSLIPYYLLALPIAIPLVFLTPLGILGLWYGTALGITILGIVYFMILSFKLDWKALCEEAKLRASAERVCKGYEKMRHEPSISEKAALLQASFSLSHSLTVEATKELHRSEYGPPPEDSKPVLTTRLLLKRGATAAIFVAIFAAGLVLRLLLERSNYSEEHLMPVNTTSGVTIHVPVGFNITM